MSSPATVSHPPPPPTPPTDFVSPVKPIMRPLRPIHGRTFSVQIGDYALPIDSLEQHRLDKQHTAIKLHLGSLYVHREKVQAVLASPGAAIVDLGTGSGSWALDMAAEFPQVDVKAMDLVPSTLVEERKPHGLPSNFRYELGDAATYIKDFDAAFDLVHARAMESGVSDFHGFLYDVAKSLRPGGVLLLASGSPQLYREDRSPLPYTDEGEPGFTWIQRTMGAVYDAILKSGKFYVNHNARWTEYLENNPNFTEVETVDYFIPMGPYTPNMTDQQIRAAEFMRQAIIELPEALKPLLLSNGMDAATADHHVKESIRELRDRDHPPAWIRWRHTFAVRTDAPWVPRQRERSVDDFPTPRTVVHYSPAKVPVLGYPFDSPPPSPGATNSKVSESGSGVRTTTTTTPPP